MLKKTHLAIGIAITLYFLRFVNDNHRFLFIPFVLISSLLPDIDSMSSNLGKKRIFRPVQIFFEHRGPFHSYTFCIIFSLFFAFLYPVLALPFFLGYSFHLLADSFTVNGIRPFWPLKYNSSGFIKVGGMIERGILGSFIIIDIFLIVMLFVG